MAQKAEIEQAIAKEIKVDLNGHGTITARGAARLLGAQNLNRGAEQMPSKLAETFTQQGIDPAERPFNEVALTLIAEYYAYEAQKTTEQAKQVYRTLAAIGARTWMQKVTGWTEKELPAWHGARRSGKDSRRSVTDAIKEWLERHPEVTGNQRKFIYANMTDQVYQLMYGARAKAIRAHRQVPKAKLLRDTMTEKELRHLEAVEDLTMRLIDEDDWNPIEAAKEAVKANRLTGAHPLPALC